MKLFEASNVFSSPRKRAYHVAINGGSARYISLLAIYLAINRRERAIFR